VLNPIGVAVLSLAIWQQPEAAPAPVVIPAASRQLLERNAKDLDGLELDIAVGRRLLVEASTLPAELRSLGEEDFLAPELNIVRISGARFYEKSTQGRKGNQIGERTYDGRLLYSGRPPEANQESLLTLDTVERGLAKVQRSGFPVKHFYWNYFEEAGYHLPGFLQEIGESPSSLVLHLAKLGRVVSWVENATTGMHEVVLESPDPWSQLKLTPEQIKNAVSSLLGESKKYQEALLQRLVERSKSEPLRRYRFSLDPTLDLAVREEWETTSKGELLSHTVCEDLTKVQDRNVRLPKACRVLIYASERFPSYISKTPLYEVTANLKKAEPRAFSDKDFELWYDKPGGAVFDHTAQKTATDKTNIYRVPGSASELARASNGALGVSKTGWLIIINSVVLLIMVVYIIRRRGVQSK
jgi:hypothetical protein